jgi:cytochrome P450
MTVDSGILNRINDQANRPNPYPLYRELRRNPVSFQETPDGVGTYVVANYRDAVAVLQDPRLSSDRRNGPPEVQRGNVATTFIELDPPVHDTMRARAMRHFGPPHRPTYVHGLYDRIVEMTDEILDDIEGRDEIDVVADLAYALPVKVICQILGVPAEDEPRFSHWVDDSLNLPMTSDAGAAARRNMADYMGDLIDLRRTDPRDDMLSQMATENGPDGPWDQGTLVKTATALLVAGHETTVNLIANGVLTLLRHPEHIQPLRDEPGRVIPMVEELLRYEPPAQFLGNRYSIDDITIDGVTIPKGSSVTVALAAANRDPQRFPDPETFHPDRTDNTHLGFSNGIHYCFGAPLARIEAQIALRGFFSRFETAQLVVDPPTYRPSPSLRGPDELLVAIG